MSTTSPLITGTDFITVATRDFDEAVKFYGTVLGLPESKRWGNRPAAEFETNNNPIEFQVDDVEAARGELESRGVEFEAETLDSGVCHQAFFKDPDGNALAIHHRYAPEAGQS